jgi:hypothetical protein
MFVRYRWNMFTVASDIKNNNNTNPLKPKLVEVIFKNSVRTSKKTQLFTITKISSLMLFKEIIAAYSEKHMKLISTK